MARKPRLHKKPFGEIVAAAREYAAEHDWLHIERNPVVKEHDNGAPGYWVAAWVRVGDDD